MLLAAGGTIVAVVAVIVVLATGEDHPYDEAVVPSSLDDFPTRGPLAADDDLVEAAADVWRAGDSYRTETRPGGTIELLWAGDVKADAVKGLVTDKDTPDRVAVVILHSSGQIATFAERQIDDERPFDGIGISELSVYSQPLITAPGQLVVTADELPTTYEAVDETGVPYTEKADDGLISSTGKGLALRLDDANPPRSTTDEAPGILLDGRVLTFGAADLDRTWSLLSDPLATKPLRTVVGALVTATDEAPRGGLVRPKVEIVSESTSPEGRSLLVLSAVDETVTGFRTAAAVDYRAAADSTATVISLGRAQTGKTWVGSAWMKPAGSAPYLVAAGAGELSAIQVYLGRQSERLDPPGGVVIPEGDVGDDELPPVVVAGFAKDDTVVPAMPIG